jgi:hypothetical protein
MLRHSSLFCQLLEVFPRHEFQAIVRDIGTERHSKGFSSWDHFVSMVFCHLAQAKSLREICDGLRTCLGKLNHLGMAKAPCRSTLSYANQHRSWVLFETIFYHLSSRIQVPGQVAKRLKLPGKLYSLDASVIPLCLSMFDWARYRSTKGAVKLHLVLDHDGYLPRFANITAAAEHDLTSAHHLKFPAGSVVVVDRGYWSLTLFANWINDGVFFVTRQRRGHRFTIIEKREVTGNILADHFVEVAGTAGKKHYKHILRRVVYRDPQNGRIFTYITNQLGAPAQVIADVYRERWQIELFFKAIKQNLKIKTFIGTTANAVMTQIWTALVVMLLLRYLQLKARRGWALSNLVTMVRWNLFTYRDLWIWLDDPFLMPPGGPPVEQLLLDF